MDRTVVTLRGAQDAGADGELDDHRSALEPEPVQHLDRRARVTGLGLTHDHPWGPRPRWWDLVTGENDDTPAELSRSGGRPSRHGSDRVCTGRTVPVPCRQTPGRG